MDAGEFLNRGQLSHCNTFSPLSSDLGKKRGGDQQIDFLIWPREVAFEIPSVFPISGFYSADPEYSSICFVRSSGYSILTSTISPFLS